MKEEKEEVRFLEIEMAPSVSSFGKKVGGFCFHILSKKASEEACIYMNIAVAVNFYILLAMKHK